MAAVATQCFNAETGALQYVIDGLSQDLNQLQEVQIPDDASAKQEYEQRLDYLKTQLERFTEIAAGNKWFCLNYDNELLKYIPKEIQRLSGSLGP